MTRCLRRGRGPWHGGPCPGSALPPPVGIEALAEVPLPVEQAHTHHGDPEAAGRFQVVPGQDPEASGVLGESLGYAELRRKVRHLHQGRAAAVLEPAVDVHVAPQVGVYLAQERHEGVVFRQGLETLPGHQGEDPYGVVLGPLPEVWVDPVERRRVSLVPRPSQVERQFLEGGTVSGSLALTVKLLNAFIFGQRTKTGGRTLNTASENPSDDVAPHADKEPGFRPSGIRLGGHDH